jgi:hypothetical protein
MTHLFLDLDGVLADFDAGAKAVLDMSPREFEAKHGKGEFWRRLARAKDFITRLCLLLPDAMVLFDAVKHLDSDHPHRPAARQLGGPAEDTVGSEAFSGDEDHQHHGPRQIQTHDRHGRAGRPTAPIIVNDGKPRAGSSSTTRMHVTAFGSWRKSIRRWWCRPEP